MAKVMVARGTRNRVVNHTTYPDAEVRRIVLAQLRDAEVSGLQVTVRFSKGRSAHGWWRAHWYPSRGEDRPQIAVYIPGREVEPSAYEPYQRKREQGKTFHLADWREALVALVAHEAEHDRQYHVLGERREKGKRRLQVELRCDLAAYRAWRRWREKHPQAEAA